MASSAPARPESTTRPDPDPTVRTNEQLQREVAVLRELIEVKLDAVNTRFNGMDKAIELLQATSNRSPTINEVFVKHEQMFANIETQFSERDTRTEQTSKDSKVAVDAALQAAKEAVGAQNESNSLAIAKSEAATTKQIDAMGALITATAKAADEKIDDLKGRLASIEGRSKGLGDGWGYIVGGLASIAAVGAIIALIIGK